MRLNERIDTLVKLGERLAAGDEFLQALMQRTQFHNAWFTLENQQSALEAIVAHFLQREQLENWVSRYSVPDMGPQRSVGLIMAGNIPLVGFHDLLAVFVAGHKALIKLSEKDKYVLPHILKMMADIHPGTTAYFEVMEKLKGFEAVIATGSDNTSRYFEAYFGNVPHIIRRNRNGVAVLTGKENREELHALGRDIFHFFGLGCRNVSKIYVPKGYEFDPLLEELHDYREIVLNNKYKNNFDYNFAMFSINRVPFLSNGCLLVVEDAAIPSRIGSLHYEFFEETARLEKQLESQQESIQVIVAKEGALKKPTVSFGKTQEPGLMDYPDGVDTMEFLLRI